MGNLCGKESNDDPFSKPGRTLGSAPPPSTEPPRAAVPSRAAKPTPHVGGPNRTVGGGASTDISAEDPRSAAARAAEARAQRGQAKGKLGEQLAAQKKQTQTATLDQTSREERGARDADAGAEARAWN